MKTFCPPQKRCSLYKKLHIDITNGRIHTNEIVEICRLQRVPLLEKDLIVTAIKSGHGHEGLDLAQQIAHSVYDTRKRALIHSILPVILLMLSTLILFSIK